MSIRLQDMTPDVYYKQSRDFQFIGRLFDIVLNAVKTNADMIYDCPFSDNSDSQLIDLMTLTLGFKSRHNYNVQQLTALCSAFAYILKNKGNRQAIEAAVNTLVNAEGITDRVIISIDKDRPHIMEIRVPEAVSDINLLRDLLDYILPAGTECQIIREAQENKQASEKFHTQDNLNWKWTNIPNTVTRDGAGIDNTWLSTVPQVQGEEPELVNAEIKATPGILPHSLVWKPDDSNE